MASLARAQRRAKMRLKAAKLIVSLKPKDIPDFEDLESTELDGLKPLHLAAFRAAYNELRQERLRGNEVIIDDTKGGLAFFDQNVIVKRSPRSDVARIHFLLDLLVPYRDHATLHCEFEELLPIWIARHGDRLGRVIAYMQCGYTVLNIYARSIELLFKNLLK